MTAKLLTEVRPASLPVYCSACFGQYPERRHIDMGAACDRGVLQYGIDGAVPISMDDLILCENCVKNAGGKLGMIDADEWQNEKAALEQKVAAAEERATHSEAHAEHLKMALATRPEPAPVQALVEHSAVSRGLCACGCGEEVKPGRRWRQGHHAKTKASV